MYISEDLKLYNEERDTVPNYFDGFSPTDRRILYSVYDMERNPAYSKVEYENCAGIIGHLLSNYETGRFNVAYDELCKLVQPFKSRYPYLSGQGNFGSIDGDLPSWGHYNKVKVSEAGRVALQDLEANVVPHQKSLGEFGEPLILPVPFPNLLVSGHSSKKSRIPSHNVGEVIDAAIHLLENPEASTSELLEIIQGPDFATGGTVYCDDWNSLYESGEGRIRIRGEAEISTDESGRSKITIHSIPFGKWKSQIVEQIVDKKIRSIVDLRDESKRDEVNFVIILKDGEEASTLLEKLYEETDLQTWYEVRFIVEEDGEQRTTNLKNSLSDFLRKREELEEKLAVERRKKIAKQLNYLNAKRMFIKDFGKYLQKVMESENSISLRSVIKQEFKDLSFRDISELDNMKTSELHPATVEMIEKRIVEKKHQLEKLESHNDAIKETLLKVKELMRDERRTKIEGR